MYRSSPVLTSRDRSLIWPYHLNRSIDRSGKGCREDRTFEIDLYSTVFQFDAENILAECFMIMRNLLFRSSTERQGKVVVGFLSIVIGTNGVHPENDFLTIVVLNKALVRREEERRSYFMVMFIGMNQGQTSREEQQGEYKRWRLDHHRCTFNSFN